MYNLHNKVTEDPSILPNSRRWNAEYLTIVKLFLDVRVYDGELIQGI